MDVLVEPFRSLVSICICTAYAGLAIATGHNDCADVLRKHIPCSLPQASRSSWLVAVNSSACRHAHTINSFIFSNTSVTCESHKFNQMCERFAPAFLACTPCYRLLKHLIYHNGLICRYFCLCSSTLSFFTP